MQILNSGFRAVEFQLAVEENLSEITFIINTPCKITVSTSEWADILIEESTPNENHSSLPPLHP